MQDLLGFHVGPRERLRIEAVLAIDPGADRHVPALRATLRALLVKGNEERERFDAIVDAFLDRADVDAACMACALFRRDALEAARDGAGEILDHRYFAYKEDVDLGWRLRRAGYRIAYLPECRAVHERGWREGSRRSIPLDRNDTQSYYSAGKISRRVEGDEKVRFLEELLATPTRFHGVYASWLADENSVVPARRRPVVIGVM